MRPFTVIIPILSAIISYTQAAAVTSSQPTSTDILYWPITSSEPSILARVSYDPTSSESNVISYSRPRAAKEESYSLVRVGLYTSSGPDPKQWTGTLTTWAAITGSDGQKSVLQLYLDSSNEVYHVTLKPSSESSIVSTSTSPSIELVHLGAGPRPHLNRPVVVGPGGSNTEEVIEKTFLQKYWWVFLIITFLAMSGSGEEQ
ncbi:hypothetical protein BDV29DRAFT_183053 [Aspergillus leporis]|uniref:Ser-Thr-rich glycosyl-phosphatidyl-inositol-anchored membrane family-domain-containing protein n=1 Tax=Aspergillus leporis TaxID=41062 RepID=A0A5N5WLE2_9EURO|nr:hypothetical protein BDV29DRAFT_183053 [Aspergillus leporis]